MMRYRLGRFEYFRACVYIVWLYNMNRARGKRRLSALLCACLFFFLVGIIAKSGLILRVDIAFVLIGILWYLIISLNFYLINSKNGALGDVSLSFENGLLKHQGTIYREWPASQVLRVAKKGKFLFIILGVTVDKEVYLIVPDRAFAGEQAKEEFLQKLAEAAARERETKTALPAEEHEPLYHFSFFTDKSMLSACFVCLGKAQYQKQRHSRLAAVVRLAGYFGICMLILKALDPDISFISVAVGILAGVLTGVFLSRRGAVERRIIRNVEKMLKNDRFLGLLGSRETDFYEDYVRLFSSGKEEVIYFNACRGVLDTGDMYVFYGEGEGYLLSVPKASIQPEKRQDFAAWLDGRSFDVDNSQSMAKRRRMSGTVRILLTLIVFLLAGIGISSLILAVGRKRESRSPFEERAYTEYDEDFVFDPRDYPDYMPIRKQIDVLTELGFEISPDAAEHYRNRMEGSELAKVYAEGYPYYMILSDMGKPNYDTDTWDFVGYSKQVYWFDFEGWDISEDYIEILEGVQTLAGEELAFVGMSENCDDVNWKKGSGTIRVTFWLNGHPYEYDAEVMNDWLDPGFIGFLNEVLETEKFKKRIYSCSDNGQGCILFYRDGDWAEEFTEKTGIELSREMEW